MADIRYVSRGALKIEGFLKIVDLDVRDKVVLDVGASHGGFTQVMLLMEARKVYAVDVGYGLLDWKLRNNDKVVVMERFNAKNLTKDLFDDEIEIGLIDVSFISLKKILPVVFNIVTEKVVALVKPQFEATYKEASKGKGVIEDTGIHERVIEEIKETVYNPEWKCIGLYPSNVKGKKGNQEYFIYYENIRTQ